jgi:PAS domain S-box-containing protein/diguanylate cyclase (GGDEF)-like protein
MFHPASAYLGLSGLTDGAGAAAFERLAGFATRLLGVPAAFVSLVDRDAVVGASDVAGGWAVRAGTPLTRSLCRLPVASGLPLLMEDARDHPLVHDHPWAWHGEVGYAGFPFRGAAGAVAGCFCVVDERPRTWSPDEVELMIGLASLTGMLVEARDTRAVAPPEPGAAAGDDAEDGISLRTLRKAVETMQIGVTVTSLDGKILYANPAEARMHGAAPESLVGTDVRMFAPPERARPLDPQTAGSVTSWSRESVNVRSDGSTFPVLLRSDVVHGADGNPVALVTCCEDLTHRKELERELLRTAFYNPVTGLPNRELLLHRLSISVDHARRDGVGFSLLCVELDRYQMVQDTLGSGAARALLVEAGRRVSECLGRGGMVAHLAGGEFGVLLEGARGAREAVRVAVCVQSALAAPFAVDGSEIFTSTSVGIALGDSAYERADAVLRDASIAMMRARDMGGPYAVFDSAMHAEIRERLVMEGELRRGLERGELRVQYQPIVRLDTGRISGFEALVRWEHPTRGMLQPDAFIPLAEDTGLLLPLGFLVLREACTAAAAWRRLPGGEGLTMAVNLSARQFADPTIAERVAEVLRETGLDPTALELEITENVVMQHTAAVGETLRRLKELGVRLNVDDFGTGYSSLSYLHRLPVDALKIDRSFVEGVTPGGLQMVRSIVALAHTLGVAVVCEGVETAELVGELRALGCEFAQGFLFAHPMDSGAAETMVTAEHAW